MDVLKNLPRKNIASQGGRSLSLFLLIFFLALTLFIATYVTLSLRNGMQSMEHRMGADLIILPREAESDYQGALISGTPSYFYMDAAVLGELEEMDMVERYSPQLFVASADASCCSAPVQIIGIQPETDFSIRPWLEEEISEPLAEGEVYAGANIFGEVGSTIHFYGLDFTIKEKLSSTGLGYDESVFIHIDDANRIAQAAKEFGIESDYSVEGSNISSVMVDIDMDQVEEEDTIGPPAFEINQALRDYDVRAIASNDMVSTFADQMNHSSRYILIIVGMLWLLSLVIIFIVFSLMVRSRAKEWQALKIIGALPSQIRKIVLRESLWLSVSGGGLGVLFALLVSYLFANSFEQAINLPILSPNLATTMAMALATFLVTALIGPLASQFAIHRHIQMSESSKP